MKAAPRSLFFVPALIAVANLLLAARATAQTFAILHSFNGDGPPSGLVLFGNTLYGTTTSTVFAVTTDGSSFTNVHSFTDGATLSAGLVLSGHSLYGTTYGGSSSNGTVFKVNTDGTGFTNLHNFTATSPFTNSDGYVVYTNTDGVQPNRLVLANSALYGTANGGGVAGSGTVFALNTDGTGFTNLHQFTALTAFQYSTDPPQFTNGDGAYPRELMFSDQSLYVTTYGGGLEAQGSVISVKSDGTAFTNLYYFPRAINSIGPSSREVILSGNTLYGTALTQCCQTGPSVGTVFAVNIDGTGFRTLYSTNFELEGLISLGSALYWSIDAYNCGGTCPWNHPGFFFRANSDGSGLTNLLTFDAHNHSLRVLILSGDTLYGTSQFDGSGVNGTLVALHADGTGLTNLYIFSGGTDGAFPGNLILSGNTLYGTTTGGGSGGSGTIFSLSFTPQLNITASAANVILSWPTNVAGFDYTRYTLESTTDLISRSSWVSNSLAPVIINGQNTVTNALSGGQKFYRLIQ